MLTKVVERAFKKLFLDAMVVQQGRLSDKHKSASKVCASAYRILLYVSTYRLKGICVRMPQYCSICVRIPLC